MDADDIDANNGQKPTLAFSGNEDADFTQTREEFYMALKERAATDIASSARSGGRTVDVGGPMAVAVSRDCKTLYATSVYSYPGVDFESGTLVVIDTTSLAVKQKIPIGPNAEGVAVASGKDRDVVCATGQGFVTTLFLGTFARTMVDEAREVAVSPDGTFAYVPCVDNSVIVIDTLRQAIIRTIPVPGRPEGICLSRDGSTIYVSTNKPAGFALCVIDAKSGTIEKQIPLGDYGGVRGVAISPGGATAYVVHTFLELVSVVSIAKSAVTARIPVGKFPWGVAVAADGVSVYVSNVYSNTVSRINTWLGKVVEEIPAGGMPMGLTIAPDGSTLYVASYASSYVTIIPIGPPMYLP